LLSHLILSQRNLRKGSSEDSDEDSNEGAVIDPEDSDDDGYGSF